MVHGSWLKDGWGPRLGSQGHRRGRSSYTRTSSYTSDVFHHLCKSFCYICAQQVAMGMSCNIWAHHESCSTCCKKPVASSSAHFYQAALLEKQMSRPTSLQHLLAPWCPMQHRAHSMKLELLHCLLCGCVVRDALLQLCCQRAASCAPLPPLPTYRGQPRPP